MYISNALTGTTYLTLPMFIPYGINIAAFSALTYQGTSEDNVLSFENIPNPELGYTDTTTSLSSSFEPSDFNVLPKRGDFVYVDSIMECRRIKDVVYSSTPIDLNNLPLGGSYFVLEEPFTTRVISEPLYIIRKEDLEKGGVAYPVVNLEISEWNYGHASIVTTALAATSVIKTGQNPKESEILFFKSDGCIVHGYLVSGLDV